MKNGLKRTVAVILAFMLLCLTGCGGTPFSSEEWRRADEIGRQKMVGSLMKEYDPVGWTEEDVLRLLGPETSADPDFTGSVRYDTEDTLVYGLGAVNYSDMEVLVVTLDADRIVTKWELVRWSM